jgi:hypothetical protein
MLVAEARALQRSQAQRDAEDDQALLRSLIRKLVVLHGAGATAEDIGNECVFHLDIVRYHRDAFSDIVVPFLTDTPDGIAILTQAAKVLRERRLGASL